MNEKILRKRCTKIICTLGENSSSEEAITNMMKSGMDIARLNMNYFDVSQLDEITSTINEACNQTKMHCSTLVDLKGPVISILPFK